MLGLLFAVLLSAQASWAQDTCGKPTVSPSVGPSFIVGGAEAIPHSWPWMGSLHLRSLYGDQKDYGHSCGASLIAPGWVLTAAHCINLEFWEVRQHSVVFGQHHYSQDEGVTYQVSEIYKHEEYVDDVIYNNDIALLRLEQDVRLDDKIQLVCLPPKDYQYSEGTKFMVTGWGHTQENGTNSPVLKQVEVNFIPQDVCSEPMDYRFGRVHEKVLCAGRMEGGHDSCQNDSGGPLVLTMGGRWVQAGIVSWGFGCARPGNPAVYTNVAAYVDWINQKINQ